MKGNLKLFLIALICFHFSLNENTEIKLSGDFISPDKSSKTFKNIFDGDYKTEYISPSTIYSWVGFKYKNPYRITKIGFAFKEESHYLLGIFEGANNSTFFDACPIYMITDRVEEGKINYVNIKTTKTFQYIRYRGPKNQTEISEFEVYGIKEEILDKNNPEKEVQQEEEQKEKKYFYQPTNIPLMFINTENNAEPYDKENEIFSRIRIIDNNEISTKGKGFIKLRGGSSFDAPKKGYKIEFTKKKKVLGSSYKAKTWLLIGNLYDKTLVRNKLGQKICTLFKINYTPVCKYIDLIINGDYRGNYLICDKIEVRKGRLNITKMDSNSTEEPDITGGYLLEGDGNFRWQEADYIRTKKNMAFEIHYPKLKNLKEEQKNYITKMMNLYEDEVFDNVIDHIDLESFSKYFLVEEMVSNIDAIYSSFFLIKEKNDDKLYFGPFWDFDLCFDGDSRLYPTNKQPNFSFQFQYTFPWRHFYVKILNNEETIKKIKEKWEEMIDSKISAEILIDYVDELADYIKESRRLNFIRWDVLKQRLFTLANARGSYDAEIHCLKMYLKERINRLSELLSLMNPYFLGDEINRRNRFEDKELCY